ncbi:hypothetical protein [Nocardia sp. NPDC047648]|uniref:hypothetical protein n=1 Tax=Nocardia sp. NPDC047648 TaxID=3155625 RepID=UPI0033D3D801
MFWVRPDGAIATQWWNAAPNQGWNHQPFAITVPGEAHVPHAARVLNLLDAVGVDFSVPEGELTEWLRDPEFTPYPALADALLALLNSRWTHSWSPLTCVRRPPQPRCRNPAARLDASFASSRRPATAYWTTRPAALRYQLRIPL